MNDTPEQIEAAIAALEAQRAVLGDAVVAIAVEPLKARLEALRSRGQGEQRLRPATVLFMDIVGSTRLSQHLDPEDVHQVVDGALQRLTGIVAAHGGRVLQYAGDSLLALFGADQALEDDAERAVRAGLAILAVAPAIAAEVEARHRIAGFNLRVGVHSGQVLLGGGVDAEGSVRGIAVNIAARMEQTAPPGGLRISQDTYRHVRGVFEATAQEPLAVKGVDAPIRSWLVTGVRPRSFRVSNRGLEGVETRLIGRDGELARIVEAYRSARDERSLALVTLVGEPGIGKSRLGLEFVEGDELRRDGALLFQARPQPYGHNVPFGVVRDLFVWRFGILDGDTQAAAQAKLAAGLAPVLGERAAEYTALIGQLIGLEFDADRHIAGIADEARQLRDRAFHALAQYFRRLHEQAAAPIVLLLDDLHWADDGSLDFVNHLAKACAELPLFVLGMTRSTLYERRPLWGSGMREHVRIDLAPLSRRSSRELVDTLLGRLDAVPDALRELLTSSAEGNPFFVEELIGMLIDDGVIVAEGERWHVVADKLLGVHVPGTLAGVLQARIDALPADEKAALQTASVIGHVFWDDAVRRIAPQADAAVDGLMRRELTYGRETSAFEGTREFVFKHHVLHQVAYQSVLKRPRQEQHRIAADWLVLRSGDRKSEYFGSIAEHYERAGDAGNALVYLKKAGEDAAKGYVHQAALDFLGRALALAAEGDHATRFELLKARRGVWGTLGRRREQEADVAELERLAEALDHDGHRAYAAAMRSAQALVAGDYAATAAAAANAVARAEAIGDPGAALYAHINWGRALQFQGDYDGAQRRIEESLALARAVGHRAVECTSLLQLGIHAVQRGHYGAARDRYAEALALARESGNRALENVVTNNLGDIEQMLGNYDAAFAHFEHGRRVSAEIGQRAADAYLLCNMAHVALRRGDAAESIRCAELAGGYAAEVADPELEASLANVRGHALVALGRLSEAEPAYRRAAEIYRQTGRPTMLPEALCGLARLALAQEAVGDALGHLADVLAHLDAGGTVDGSEDPLWVYLTCHDVLAAAGDARARELLGHGHRLLMARAAPLGEAERASFLGNVPSHRAIVAAWTAVGAAPG